MYENHKTSNYDFTKIPFDDIVRFGQRTLLYRDLFTVSWLLGRYCNYRCSYCWPFARSDTKDHRPTEVCLKTVDEIKRQARENGFNSFHFSLSGGEPSFHPGYLDILKHLADDVSNTNYTSIHMTSNCSRPMKWFETYVEYSKPFHRANITCSLHTEHVITEEKMQELANKLILCQENDIQVTVNIVMVPERFNEYYQNAMFMHNQGINVTLKAQTDPSSSFVVSGYTEEQLLTLRNGLPQIGFTQIKKVYHNRPIAKTIIPKNSEPDSTDNIPLNMQVELTDKNNKKWYMDQAERFNAFGFNKFKGWMCNSGYQGIIIREPDGTIKRSYGCIDVPLGHIETGFNLFKEPKICISDTCTSSADSKIPKKK
jgi:organic radical activating enzyme